MNTQTKIIKELTANGKYAKVSYDLQRIIVPLTALENISLGGGIILPAYEKGPVLASPMLYETTTPVVSILADRVLYARPVVVRSAASAIEYITSYLTDICQLSRESQVLLPIAPVNGLRVDSWDAGVLLMVIAGSDAVTVFNHISESGEVMSFTRAEAVAAIDGLNTHLNEIAIVIEATLATMLTKVTAQEVYDEWVGLIATAIQQWTITDRQLQFEGLNL